MIPVSRANSSMKKSKTPAIIAKMGEKNISKELSLSQALIHTMCTRMNNNNYVQVL